MPGFGFLVGFEAVPALAGRFGSEAGAGGAFEAGTVRSLFGVPVPGLEVGTGADDDAVREVHDFRGRRPEVIGVGDSAVGSVGGNSVCSACLRPRKTMLEATISTRERFSFDFSSVHSL
jgi:hypothetical protein